MEQVEDTDEFHNSEQGDIYDLYNACNGVMLDGLLDISKLDELSPEEQAELDMLRLRKVWMHTASGCLECKYIIETLNLSRGTLRAGAGA